LELEALNNLGAHRGTSYNGAGVIPMKVVPVNFPCESKFHVNMANPARAQAWHPLIKE